MIEWPSSAEAAKPIRQISVCIPTWWESSKSALSATTSHPRNLLSMARLNIAKSRVLPAICSLVWIDQTCFGRSGGFAPVSLPFLSKGQRSRSRVLTRRSNEFALSGEAKWRRLSEANWFRSIRAETGLSSRAHKGGDHGTTCAVHVDVCPFARDRSACGHQRLYGYSIRRRTRILDGHRRLRCACGWQPGASVASARHGRWRWCEPLTIARRVIRKRSDA